jgi:aspartate 1-decarboxylase
MVSDYCVEVLKSKLHRAEVTGGNVNYEGSLTISEDLMEKVGILPYEKVLCGNQSNGSRFETYALPGPSGKGEIVLNGATARLGEVGDLLTIMTYATVQVERAREWNPRVAVLSNRNLHADCRLPDVNAAVGAEIGVLC